MDEKTIISLISLGVRNILREHNICLDKEKEQSLALGVADVAWNGLILGLREIFASSKPAILDEFGRFEFSGSGWSFYPAVSILEAGAIGLQPKEGNEQLAIHALFYISQATTLISRLSSEFTIESPSLLDERTPLEKSMTARHPGRYSMELSKHLADLFTNFEYLKLILKNMGYIVEEEIEKTRSIDDKINSSRLFQKNRYDFDLSDKPFRTWKKKED